MPDKGGTRQIWRKRRKRRPGRPAGPGIVPRLRAWLRRRSKGARIGICAAAGVLGVLLAAFLIVLSPLTSAFMAPRIADAIERALGPGYEVGFGGSRVDLTMYGLDVRFDGFEIRAPGGDPILAVPRAAVALDGNLLRGANFSLRRIRLTQPNLTLRIAPDGQIAFGGAEGRTLLSLPAADAPQGAPAEISGFLATAEAVLAEGGQLENFELAEIENAKVTIDDQRRGRVEEIDQVDLHLQRRRDDTLTASAASAKPQERWSVTASLSGKASGVRNFDLGFENLSLGRIAYEALRGQGNADFGGRLFGHVYARLEPNGSVPAAEARLDLVNFSVVERDKPEARMDADRTRLQLVWNAQERRLRVNPMDVEAHNARFVVAGEAHPVDEAMDRWEYRLSGKELTAPGADPRTHALKFDSIAFSGSFQRSARLVVIEKGAVQGRSLSVAGYGTFDFSGEKPMADFAIAGSRSPVAAVLRVWPGLIAPGTRKWLEENVSGGVVEDMSIAMRGPIGGKMLKRDLALDARFSNATVTYLKDVPPAVGVHGNVRVVNERMETIIEGGRVELGSVEPLAIAGTRFATLDHRPEPFLGELDVKFEGPVATVGALMSVPRLAQMAPSVAPLMRGKGTVSAVLRLDGEYGRGAEMSRLVPRIEANLNGWSMQDAIGNRDIDNGNFTLNVEPEAANLRGEVRLSGSPVAVEAILNRTDEKEFGETIVRFSLDPSKMKDFDSEALRISGPISAELVQEVPGRLANSRMRADLTGASVEGPVGLAKAAGSPGQVSFTVRPNGDSFRLDEFVAQGSGIDIRGTVDLSRTGALASANFTRFRAAEGDDARLEVSKTGEAYRIVVQGSSFNVQPIIKDITSGAPEKRALDIDVEAKLGTVIGHNGEILTGADLKVSRRSNITRNFSLTGLLGSGPVEARTTGEGANRVHSLRAADGGALLRFVDLYRRVRGGVLTLDVTPGETNIGLVRLRNFQVVGDEQLNMVASRSQQGRRNSGSNGTMTFTQLDSKFRLGGGRILIDDFEVYGNEIGASLGGEINYVADKVGISGTFVPAYALNNLFGKVPLFGQILGGGSDGGLVGITFAIDGAWSRPQMRVNPLSAVAPGFLRKLFEFRSRTERAEGTNAPSVSPQSQ